MFLDDHVHITTEAYCDLATSVPAEAGLASSEGNGAGQGARNALGWTAWLQGLQHCQAVPLFGWDSGSDRMADGKE